MSNKYQLLVACALLFACSLYIRTIRLSQIPSNLNPDEADTLGRYVGVVYAPDARPPLFEFNWNGAPIVNTYIVGASWQLFHESMGGARFPSALFTSFGIVVIFIVITLITHNIRYAFLIGLALASNPWLISFSRSAWENAWTMLPLGIMMLGYELSMRGNTRALYLMTIGAVWGFYGYHPGKTFIIPLILGLLLLMIRYKKQIKTISIIVLCNIFLYGLLIAPQLIASYENRSMSFGRIETVSILQEPDPIGYFKQSVVNNIRGLLFFAPDTTYLGLNARYVPLGVAPISHILMPFFLLGLMGTLIRRNHHIWYGLTFICVLFPVQLFSRGTPDAARGVHAVGLYYFLIALGGWYLWSIMKKMHMFRSRRSLLVLSALFISTMCYVIFSDITQYFSWITSAQALGAREPAISAQEYGAWKNDLTSSVRLGGRGFSVEEWKARVLLREHKVIVEP